MYTHEVKCIHIVLTVSKLCHFLHFSHVPFTELPSCLVVLPQPLGLVQFLESDQKAPESADFMNVRDNLKAVQVHAYVQCIVCLHAHHVCINSLFICTYFMFACIVCLLI